MNLICADCLDAMQAMPEKSVDAIVTDPPYGLEFMGKEWDRFSGGFSKNEDWEHGNLGGLPRQRHRNIKCPECDKWIYDHPPDNCTCGGIRRTQMRQYEQFGYAWAVEALRVAKPGAHLLAFGGTRTWHRLACALEDAGWEIRDTIMWVYGSGFPKSHDISKAIDREAGAEREVVGKRVYADGTVGHVGSRVGSNDGWKRPWQEREGEEWQGKAQTAPATPDAARWQGWGTALKPAWEPIIVARKPVNCTVAENVLKWGTGGINVDGCRIGFASDADEGETKGKNQHTHYKNPNSNRDSYSGSMPPRQDYTAQGRWPANLIHDGSDEVLAGFPQSSVTGRRVTEHKRTPAVNTPFTMGNPLAEYTDSGSAARFFYCAKASKQDRDEGCEGMPYHTAGECTDREEGTAGLESPRAGAGRTNGSRNHHPTVKPTALMRYLCRLVTPPGGTVLDPFAGSGSTGKAAVLEGFEFVGIEKDAEYCEIARARIAKAQEQMEERLL